MPAIAAPPAPAKPPKQAASPAAPAEPIVIPPLAQISPGAEPSPPPVVPPVEAPPTTIVPPAGDDDQDDTSIISTAQRKKSDSEFAAQRTESKVERVKIELTEAQRQAEEAKIELARITTEREETQRKIVEAEKQRDEFKTEAERLRGEVTNVNERYFQNNEAVLDPSSDEQLRESSAKLFGALSEKMPSVVTSEDGSEKRVFIDQMVRTPAIANALEQLVGHYAMARQNGDAKGIDRAISAAAQILGARAFVGETEAQDQLLASTDPIYREIESALKEAIPHYVAKGQRFKIIKEEGPKLVQQRLAKKEQGIRTRLESAIFMEEKDVTARLQSNPTDSHALFAAILNRAPHLREVVQAKVTAYATAFSRMREGIDLPVLTKNDPVSIAEHRRQVDQINETLAHASSAAVIGDAVGPILASLIAERDSAVARAEAAATNTNPGSTRPGGDGGAPEEELDTQIVK